jgi:predicted Zn-dependent protease
VERYFATSGLQDQLVDYKWEFNLVEDKQINAWCMPGGKVVVYTGLLPVARDEAGLAVVMGHEIAHAIAEHGNERMSQGLLTQLGGVALSTALSTKSSKRNSSGCRSMAWAPNTGRFSPMAACRRVRPITSGWFS